MLADRGVAGPVTAVVTVADDGGSSGRLRRELGLLPPGDLRMALAALAGEQLATGTAPDPTTPWIRLLQHRFGGTGALAGHAVGNLLLAGLMEVLDDPVTALDEVGALVGARGRVLPMACEPLDIEAEVTGLEDDDPHRAHRIRGQVRRRVHPRSGYAGSGCSPSGRRPAAPPSRRYGPRTCCCWAPVPGSPASCHTCSFPSYATRSCPALPGR
jgi:uncharacterized cofD-like protein